MFYLHKINHNNKKERILKVDSSGFDCRMCQCILKTDLMTCELGEYVAMHVTESFLFFSLVLKSSAQGLWSAVLYAWSLTGFTSGGVGCICLECSWFLSFTWWRSKDWNVVPLIKFIASKRTVCRSSSLAYWHFLLCTCLQETEGVYEPLQSCYQHDITATNFKQST